MKLATIFLLALGTFFGFNDLSASTTNELEKHVTFYWDGNEEELYFNIDLSTELEFPSKYNQVTFTNGQGCEFICKPLQNTTILSSDGNKLEEIIVSINITNQNNPNKIDYTAVFKSLYKGNKTSSIITDTYEGVLKNPSVDLTQEPVFFLNDDGLKKGVVSFKNAFPYSQIK